jgi:hypothetical protein
MERLRRMFCITIALASPSTMRLKRRRPSEGSWESTIRAISRHRICGLSGRIIGSAGLWRRKMREAAYSSFRNRNNLLVRSRGTGGVQMKKKAHAMNTRIT